VSETAIVGRVEVQGASHFDARCERCHRPQSTTLIRRIGSSAGFLRPRFGARVRVVSSTAAEPPCRPRMGGTPFATHPLFVLPFDSMYPVVQIIAEIRLMGYPVDC